MDRRLQPRRRHHRDEATMAEIIDLGALRLRFLQSKDDTAGSLDMFEMTLQTNARMPIPHYHENWDETIYGLAGTTTWRVDGKDIDVAPGETVFIRRGIVHGFTNRTSEPATCLCTLSPGVIGPQYFRDMAVLLTGGTPDPAKMKQTMLRYGLIPAP
jgi:quercetin dioxygenase-like cupin family protein